MRPDPALAVLPFGHYYGCPTTCHHAPGIEVQVLEADPSRVVEWHSHDDAHLIYVMNGLYLSAARGGALHRAGTVIYNPPGTLHRDRFESVLGRVSGRFLAVAIDRSRLSRMPPVGSSATVLDQAAGRMADAVLRGLATGDGALVRRETDRLCRVIGLARSLVVVPAWLERARVLLADPDDGLGDGVAGVATTLGVHRVHLARRFRTAFGVGPAAYRLHRRADRAIGLLRDTALPIGQIAAQAGFFDQSHLTRVVRRITGRSPAAYRRHGPPGHDGPPRAAR